jgi:hypothetical protein
MNYPKRKTVGVEPLNENLTLRRRLDFNILKQEIDNMVDYEMDICDHYQVGDFIVTVCDILTDRIVGDIAGSTRVKISPKETDILYNYILDTFGSYLVKVYMSTCHKNLNETKKTYVVTESQYNKLIESEGKLVNENTDEKLNRKIKLIKRFIDDIISPKYPICNVDVYISKGIHRDVLMAKIYLNEKMSNFKRDEMLDDIWNSVYNMFGTAVGLESVDDEC